MIETVSGRVRVGVRGWVRRCVKVGVRGLEMLLEGLPEGMMIEVVSWSMYVCMYRGYL